MAPFATSEFLKGIARAFAGAIIFSIQLLMTMELWWIGFYIDSYRLALYIFSAIPMLIYLSKIVGFESTNSIIMDVVDAFVAYFIGFITAGLILYLFGVLDVTMSVDEIMGIVSIQSVTCAMGALFAQSQLGSSEKDKKKKKQKNEKKEENYWKELFILLIGALFLAMPVAATEEVYLIAFKMTDVQSVLLMLFSLVVMHAFVYGLNFKGQHDPPEGTGILMLFLRFTVVGYAIALLVSCYVLWILGSIDNMSLGEIIRITVVLGFPAALGAAASRLIL